jgi:hypothetical protein
MKLFLLGFICGVAVVIIGIYIASLVVARQWDKQDVFDGQDMWD